jgi:hypothetical protein
MPAKNIAELHAAVAAELSKKPEVVNKRRKAIAALRKGKSKGLKLPLPKKRKAWFSTNQTDTSNSLNGARVQVLGIDVGELKLNEDETCYVFHPNGKNFPEFQDVKWKWSKDAKDAKKIRNFLAECETHSKAAPGNEREIQWQLANALGDGKLEPFRNLQPVTWCKRFTEIGVSVTISGKAATGNIDLLVRRSGRGFLVFEVKAPGKTDIEATLQQALRYATALHIEANEGTSKDLENYNSVFGSNSKKELKIGAVIVMQNKPKVSREAAKIITQYCSVRGDSKIDRLGVLLYDFDGSKVTGWKWLNDDCDPRNPQLWPDADA